MPRKLKVWGGNWDGQKRGLVAAHTKKEALEIINGHCYLSMGHFNDYWAETGNEEELALATELGLWLSKGSALSDEGYERLV